MKRGAPIRTLSLRAHLLLLVVGTMVPALVLAGFLVGRVVADKQEAVTRRLLEAARGGAALVDAELGGTVRALQGLAQSDRLTSGDVHGFYDQARRLLPTQPAWAAVALATPGGRQLVNTSRPLGDPLPFVIERASFDRAVGTKSPVIGNLRVGHVTGQLGFPVRVPVIRRGRVVYILSAWITSEGFASVLQRQGSLSDEWVRGIVDAGGILVARSRDPERFVGRKAMPDFLRRNQDADEGVYRGRSLDGAPIYTAFSRAPSSRWIAAVAVRTAVLDAPFRQSLLALGAASVLLFGVGGLGAYVVSRRISRDLSESAAEAEAIAEGRRASRPRSRVTELQRLLDALGRSAALLEKRQHERDQQVARADAARADAEAADRAKDQFLAMLGHELRNPLAPALTALELMKRRAGDAARQRDVIERQIRHMARLVDDLLDVSRLRRGAIELRRERFDLGEVVGRAVEMTAPAFAEKGHQLDVDVPPGLTVDADRVRIAQVLANLLSNAAKYTDPGGHVLLRARADAGDVRIDCRDDGVGMPADLVPHAFDLFVQGQRGLDRHQGGLGLGLAVARTLIELHGGTIEAGSAGPGQGSTFTVRLPAAAPVAEIGRRDEASVAPRNAVGRVLVVDDNHDAMEMLVEALNDAGIEALGASGSAEALEVASHRPPRAAVLDIGLPEMDGLELARALRSLDGGGRLRLVALTGYGREQDMRAAREAGFDAFLVKPVDIAALLIALSEPVKEEPGRAEQPRADASRADSTV